jgi:HlyD family secretion protein
MRFVAVSLALGSIVAVPATGYLPAFNGYLHAVKLDGVFASAEQDGPARYVTASVKTEEIAKTVMATGTLVPALNVEVGSVLSGQVSKLLVDFNDKVVKGQVLAELDDRTYALAADASRAALEGAKSEVSVYEARLKRALLDLWQTQHQLPVLEARVGAAKAVAEVTERELKRKQWLAQREVAAVADVQNVQARRDAATSALKEAEVNVANQTGLVSAAEVDVDRASAEVANAQANETRLQAVSKSATVDLERTKIRAPIDGIVVGRTITEGQTLATGLEAKTLFILAGDLGNMEIAARIGESDIAGIKNGQDATFTVDAFPGRTFEAKVKQIRLAPQANSNVVTYTVVLKTPNPDGLLLPGMTVMASIVTQRISGIMTVPTAALRYKPRREVASNDPGLPMISDSVWALRNGRPRQIAVTRGEEDGKNVVVSSAELRPGDVVVVGEKHSKERRPSGES